MDLLAALPVEENRLQPVQDLNIVNGERDPRRRAIPSIFSKDVKEVKAGQMKIEKRNRKSGALQSPSGWMREDSRKELGL